MDPSTPTNVPPEPNTTPEISPQPAVNPVPQPLANLVQAPAPAQDPGKTLGIVGFVMAFVGLQLVGLILSIMGFKKSKGAGFKNTLAFAGIILNGVILGIAIILVPIFVAITITSYNGITTRANTSSAQSAAASVAKYSELYAAEQGVYPTSFAQIDRSSTNITATPTEMTSEPVSTTTIEFSSCGTLGNKIGYWDYNTQQVVYTFTGTATRTSDCVIAN